MEKDVPLLEQSDDQIMQTVRQLQVAYKLKRTLRYATQRDFTVHSESVAEHVFALFFLAQYFFKMEDIKPILDIGQVYQILLFHDFGEIVNGDVPYHQKTEEHEKREREDAKNVFASLPSVMQDVAYKSWLDYEQKNSHEAQFADALDKIEPLFELLNPINERSMKRLKFSYDDHLGKKLRATEKFPIMRRFVEVVSKDMLSRDVFWVNE